MTVWWEVLRVHVVEELDSSGWPKGVELSYAMSSVWSAYQVNAYVFVCIPTS